MKPVACAPTGVLLYCFPAAAHQPGTYCALTAADQQEPGERAADQHVPERVEITSVLTRSFVGYNCRPTRAWRASGRSRASWASRRRRPRRSCRCVFVILVETHSCLPHSEGGPAGGQTQEELQVCFCRRVWLKCISNGHTW